MIVYMLKLYIRKCVLNVKTLILKLIQIQILAMDTRHTCERK